MAELAIPFVGQAYEARSLNFSAQRCVNLFLEAGLSGAKSPAALFSTPGLTLRLQMPNGSTAIRGILQFKDLLWVVAGNTLFSVSPAFVPTIIGVLATSTGPVSMAKNETQLTIVDGVAGYYYDFPSLTFGQITDTEFPTGCRRISYLLNRFLVEAPQSQTMCWSKIGDVREWNGLDFASADASPDNIVSHLADHQELYIFGETTTQIFVAGDDGFQNSPNSSMQQGCAAAFSPASIDNSVMWLGRDELGQGIVWQTRGGATPVRVSNHGVEYAIAQYARIDDAISYVYQQEGHLFYVLTFPAAMATWVFDVASQAWHERAYMVPSTGELTRHRSNCHAMFNGRNIVGDWQNGRIYELDLNAYTDAGDTILRLRSSAAITQNQRRMVFKALQVDVQVGTSPSVGQGSAPVGMLRYSDDSGYTWSNRSTATLGKVGQYWARCRFHRLGSGRNRVFEFSVSDPVPVVIMGAFVDAIAGAW
ncbi:hypothetical protein D3C71_351490 [compost metagenome]